LAFSGATVSGATPNATVSITSSGGGAGYHPGYLSGRWYKSQVYNGTSLTSVTANRIYAHPFYVASDTTFTKIGVAITGGIGNAEVGIYNNSGGVPGTLFSDVGTISSSSGTKQITGLSLALSAGWYWLAVGCDAGLSFECFSSAGSDNIAPAAFIGDGQNATDDNIYVYVAWTFSAGSLPSPFGSVTYDNSAPPIVWLSL
jgi:hypothetical protein